MKLIGLMVTLLALGVLFYLAYGKKEPEATATPATATTLGAAPPTDVASNAKAARQFTERQSCLANCAAEDRTCTALATEAPAAAACAEAKAACEKICP